MKYLFIRLLESDYYVFATLLKKSSLIFWQTTNPIKCERFEKIKDNNS